MKNFTMILAALILTACGHQHKVEIEPVFQGHLDRFVELSGVYAASSVVIDDLVMKMEEPSSPKAIGECEIGSRKSPTIVISPTWWNAEDNDDQQREQLIFHELGHCVLHRYEHREDMIQDRRYMHPMSLMYPTEFWINDSVPMSLYYQELFTVIDSATLLSMFQPYFSSLTSFAFLTEVTSDDVTID